MIHNDKVLEDVNALLDYDSVKDFLFMNVINQFQLLLLVNNTLIRKHTYSSDFNHLKKFETEHKQD